MRSFLALSLRSFLALPLRSFLALSLLCAVVTGNPNPTVPDDSCAELRLEPPRHKQTIR